MPRSPRARLAIALSTFLVCCSILLGVPFGTGSWTRLSTPLDANEQMSLDAILSAESIGSRGSNTWAGRSTQDVILRSDQHVKILKIALEESEPAGQAYALIGLSIVDPVYYARVKDRFASSEALIRTYFSCTSPPISMAELIEWIDDAPKSRSVAIQTSMMLGHT